MTYAHTVVIEAPFAEAVDQVRTALAGQGFGILTEADVTATFGTKLGPDAAAELGDYLILGACRPTLAQQALRSDPSVGLLLPCNVVIRRAPGETSTTVQAIDAATMVRLSDAPGMVDVAADADTRLQAALGALDSRQAD